MLMGIPEELIKVKDENEIPGNIKEMKETIIDQEAIASKMLAAMFKTKITRTRTDINKLTPLSYQDPLIIVRIEEVVKEFYFVKLSRKRILNASRKTEYTN
jgi:hypothetical protein